ncbi:MAG: ATP-dependent Clp protease proteolytic subunit, partial [Defluviicoccus sp.]|nr:ATP-dependent Clp protease proteolytic subunit [Defluviicoccus sp.]
GTIEEAMERDRFLSPDDAKAFGIIDEVVTTRPAPEAEAAGGG